jgi:HSP20 family protein
MMSQTVRKLPVKVEQKAADEPMKDRRPLAGLRSAVDRVFSEFDPAVWRFPFRRSVFDMEPFWTSEVTGTVPVVDVTEDEKGFEITAELPGMDEKNVEVKLANGGLTIKGEKTEEKEEKQKDYYIKERHFGSFERSFRVPDGVDKDKIEATFSKGVLKVILPKTAEAQRAEKKIAVKAA